MLNIRQSQMDSMAEASGGTQMTAPCPETATWIEIRLIDEEKKPVPGQKYRLRLPDSSIVEGFLDTEGKARFDNIVAGQCSVCFSEIDAREWHTV